MTLTFTTGTASTVADAARRCASTERDPPLTELEAVEAELRRSDDAIERYLKEGSLAERKVLMNALVHEVTVTSRADVVPVFRFPRRCRLTGSSPGAIGAAGFPQCEQ